MTPGQFFAVLAVGIAIGVALMFAVPIPTT